MLRAEEDVTAAERPPATTGPVARRADLIAIAIVALVGLGVFVPALMNGLSLGPYDALLRYGLTADLSITPHNLQRADLVTEIIPWGQLVWTQVHHGSLPLLRNTNGLGVPLAFNWQSAVASLPVLLGYLTPRNLAFTVQVLVTTVIGGTGGYVAARALRLRPLASTFAAVTWMLSGPFFVLVGWPAAAVMSWAGWLIALSVMVLRGKRPLSWALALAIVWALTLLAGQPDTLVAVATSALIALALVLALVAWRSRGQLPWRRIGLLALAGGIGGGLAAPIVLPSLQLTRHSIRSVGTPDLALPVHDLVNLAFVGFDGLPYSSSEYFGKMFMGSAAWVGIIALVLALLGAIRRRGRISVTVLSVVVLVDLLLVFVPQVVQAMNGLPVVGTVMWRWSLMPMALALALLAGHGVDELVGSWRSRPTRALLWSLIGGAGLLMLAIWLLGRGELPASQAQIRAHSFLWPALGLLALAAAAGLLEIACARGSGEQRRAGALVMGALLAAQTAMLLSATTTLWISAIDAPPKSPAIEKLRSIVGNARIATGVKSCFVPPTYDVQEDANVFYGITELDAYAPMAPKSLFDAYVAASHGQSPGAYVPPSVFCPAIYTTQLARRFGVEYVLMPRGMAGPYGSDFVGRIGISDLYRIPGAGLVTVSALEGGRLPGPDAPGRPVSWHRPSSGRLVTSFRADGPSVLRLHVQRMPGWHATIDGEPLKLQTYSIAMLQARVPAGRHVVELRYWPAALSAGLIIAALSAAAWIGVAGWAVLRRRR